MYIQQSELLNDPSSVTQLMLKMTLDFTRRTEDAAMGAGSHRIIREIRSYCLQNLSRKITVQELADFARLNRSCLISVFKNDTGIGPGAYVTKLRIDEARRLLTVSGNSLSSIAAALGFLLKAIFKMFSKRDRRNADAVPK